MHIFNSLNLNSHAWITLRNLTFYQLHKALSSRTENDNGFNAQCLNEKFLCGTRELYNAAI